MRIGLVTCLHLPEPDPDAEPLEQALRARGHTVRWIAWDDPAADPGAFDFCLLRSTWNYYHVPALFLDWVERAARVTRLMNPPEVVRWNLHKRYLLELEERDIATVPTMLNPRGEQLCLTGDVLMPGWEGGVVLKPAIGAGSWRARMFFVSQLKAAQRYLELLAQSGDVLVQPIMGGFRNPGERALVWIAGEWTHAVRKRTRYHGQDEKVEATDPPTATERAFADEAIAPFRESLLYARVDVVRHRTGQPMVSEVELMEPSLFFAQGPAALERLVAGIEAFGA